MKKEYDFSQGERGKFYRPDIRLNLPVYLEKEVLAFVEKLARKRNQDISFIVNQLLRGDMQIAEMIE
jgi:polyhydroxyalkanoate synthesis regulator protein